MPRPSRRRPPVIALLTDFGLSGHFVGAMKGVILQRLPDAHILDITHDIEPGRIRHGAFVLWAAAPSMPESTVIAAVIDPGVGTERKILMLKTRRHIFVAPDNGLLDLVRSAEPKAVTYVPDAKAVAKFALPGTSSTFHGRDIFAPLAATLAGGVTPAQLGKAHRLPPPVAWRATPGDPSVGASIMSIDRFGNLVTNIPIPPGSSPRDMIRMVAVGNIMVSHVVQTYADAPDNTPCLIRGSSGLLEIVVRNGSASTLLRAHDRTPVRVVWA